MARLLLTRPEKCFLKLIELCSEARTHVAPARSELLVEVAYYSNKELGLGSRFLTALEDTTIRAFAYPLTGTPASENTRRIFLKHFPFALVYRPDENGIVVFELAHHARRPGYWQNRIDAR